ncbi:T9SS type A sorting domain-containing protein [Cytophagaceae bacterium YF14B1]|uniref:T9SS type A sorting domain-containing protein n=1 Tax=Xanthocytophaga flava TaxID=3048013 RepID=A0AAE3UB97_9BACT|nr:T9SS type A sorting domain-containing protein [Xanthocytophaga flavus]MDJ1486286.1 T9SS type A sorting domain-containing protein [Xanthocytophaga flavus]
MIKLDSQGNREWDRTLGGIEDDEALSITPTIDGNYLVAGNSLSSVSFDRTVTQLRPYTDGDTWLLKITPTGSILWQRSYPICKAHSYTLTGFPATVPSESYAPEFVKPNLIMVPHADGSFLLGGDLGMAKPYGIPAHYDGQEAVRGGYRLVRIDSAGNVLWTTQRVTTIRGDLLQMYDVSNGAIAAADGGYWLLTQGLKLIRVGERGEYMYEIWYHHHAEKGVSMQSLPGGAILLSGSTRVNLFYEQRETSRGGWDYWLLALGEPFPQPVNAELFWHEYLWGECIACEQSRIVSTKSLFKFKATPLQKPVVQTFRLHNPGKVDVIVSPPILPAGFSVKGEFASKLSAGQTTLLYLQTDATRIGTFSGQVLMQVTSMPKSNQQPNGQTDSPDMPQASNWLIFQVSSQVDEPKAELKKKRVQTSAQRVQQVNGLTEEDPPYLSQLFPNPSRNGSTLEYFSVATQPCQLTLTNPLGQIVFAQSLMSQPGWNRWECPRNGLPAGIYLLRLTWGRQSQTHKWVLND